MEDQSKKEAFKNLVKISNAFTFKDLLIGDLFIFLCKDSKDHVLLEKDSPKSYVFFDKHYEELAISNKYEMPITLENIYHPVIKISSKVFKEGLVDWVNGHMSDLRFTIEKNKLEKQDLENEIQQLKEDNRIYDEILKENSNKLHEAKKENSKLKLSLQNKNEQILTLLDTFLITNKSEND